MFSILMFLSLIGCAFIIGCALNVWIDDIGCRMVDRQFKRNGRKH